MEMRLLPERPESFCCFEFRGGDYTSANVWIAGIAREDYSIVACVKHGDDVRFLLVNSSNWSGLIDIRNTSTAQISILGVYKRKLPKIEKD